MAQQVFPQWSPVVKAHNEDQQEVYIPAAIIHAQTRDGKDELIVGAANMQLDSTTGDYLPTGAANPLEVRARALETLIEALLDRLAPLTNQYILLSTDPRPQLGSTARAYLLEQDTGR